MYRGFKTECPSGLIDCETFMSILSCLFPDGDSTIYASRLFQSFDKKGSGKITFEDLILGLSKCLHGSMIDKLRWAFHLYDLDGNGYIGKEELCAAIYGLYSLKHHLEHDDSDINKEIEEVFAALDMNDDGLITEEEFVSSCIKSPRIKRSLVYEQGKSEETLSDNVFETNFNENFDHLEQ